MTTLSHRVTAAAASGALLFSSIIPTAFAEQTPYTDVASGAYYESAAVALRAAGALDTSEARLRPNDLATRAELVKLLVSLNEVPVPTSTVSSFNDVPVSTWYSAYFEAAAKMQWVHGDGNCYEHSRPCTARPADHVNRAEAAALIARAFGVDALGLAPPFADNPKAEWYYPIIQRVADHCILQGDDLTGHVRPSANMNRAEMVVMFHRAMQNLQYGRDCGVMTPRISGVTVQDNFHLRLTFSTNILSGNAQKASNYVLLRDSNNAPLAIQKAVVVNARTVDLTLSASLDSTSTYVIHANNLTSAIGIDFSSSAGFDSPQASGQILDAVALSGTRVRVRFDANLDSNFAEERSRYTVTRVSNGVSVGVASVDYIDSRTVDVYLQSAVVDNASYLLSGVIRRSDGIDFTGNTTFIRSQVQAGIESVEIVSSSQVRVTFNTDVSLARAQESIRYTIVDSNNTALNIRTAQLLSDKRTVELSVLTPLKIQAAYNVTVASMLTASNALFSDTASVIYDGGVVALSAVLNAVQEVPSVGFDVKGTGTGTFTLQADGLHYDIVVLNLSGSITAAHFHRGASGVAGPALQAISFTGNNSTGVWTLSHTDRAALLDGFLYVNVHTTAYADGEIRGQIYKK